MKPFVQIKNKYYEVLVMLLGEIQKNGGRIKKWDLEKLLAKHRLYYLSEYDEIFIAKNRDEISQYTLICPDPLDEDYYINKYGEHFPFRASRMEKEWLKNILQDSLIDLFLKENTKKNLLAELTDIDADFFNRIEKYNNTYDESNNMLASFKIALNTIRKAIRKNCGVTYNYENNTNRYYLKPLQIEYSIKHDRYYIIGANKENQSVKLRVSKISNLEVVNEDKKVGDNTISDFTKNRISTMPIVIYLKDERKGLERAAHLFSPFISKIKFLEKLNVYEISLTYYDFEESEIISRIFSLGSIATIISPQEIQREFKTRVEKAFSRYSKQKLDYESSHDFCNDNNEE